MISFFLREKKNSKDSEEIAVQEIMDITRSVRTEQNEAILERLSRKIKDTQTQTKNNKCIQSV